jgi:hypothetical protein
MARSTSDDTDTDGSTASVNAADEVSASERAPMDTSEQPAATGNLAAVKLERRTGVMFTHNSDGSFTPTPVELPPANSVADVLNGWGAVSRGSVNKGSSWLDTFVLPENPEYGESISGVRALGLGHWDDGTVTLFGVLAHTDVKRLQDAFDNLRPGQGGLEATFDVAGKPL